MPTQFVRSAKNALKGYTSAQVLVRDATANESEGPSVDALDELAQRSYDSVEFFEIMDMIDRRLNDKGKYWRHVAKSLTVLDYLVRFGSENCVLWCKENLYVIKTLGEFRHDDDGTQDGGQIIRVKAKELTNLLNDEERLRMERGEDGGPRRRPSPVRDTSPPRRRNSYDDDLQKALDESRLTAEEDERRRKALNNEDADLQTALQLSKEEEELKRLQELQKAQQDQERMQQMQPQGYYDIFGNPISLEEYMQYQQQQEMLAQQQQQELLAQQQQQQELLAQQQEQQRLAEEQRRLAEEQQKQQEAQYWAMQQEALAQQQTLAQQQALAQQQMLAQQQAQAQEQQRLAALQKQQQEAAYFQQPVSTGSNNPFALNSMQLQKPVQQNNNQLLPDLNAWGANSQQVEMPKYQPKPQPQPQQQAEPKPMQPVRTGNQSISDKYNDLNQLLAQPTGIDTFGNVGDSRIPAQHTKTGTFINSQGTGYKQYASEPKKNPFLPTQFTGIPASSVVPSHTGYGFGNQQHQKQQAPQPADQGVSLIDL